MPADGRTRCGVNVQPDEMVLEADPMIRDNGRVGGSLRHPSPDC